MIHVFLFKNSVNSENLVIPLNSPNLLCQQLLEILAR